MNDATAPPVRTEDLPAFIRKGQDWDTDQEVARQKWGRAGWWVATGLGSLCILQAAALVILLPLKNVTPVVIKYDRTNGNTEVVDATHDRELGYTDLNAKHWAHNYVVARESYLYSILQHDYDTVLALSADDVGRSYAKLYDGTRAKDLVLGPGVEERIKVISVVLPPDQTGKAVVRFEKAIKRAGADQPESPETFVATLGFEFKPTMRGREKDLILNPLGFHVTAYRVDQEIAHQAVR